MYSTDLLAHNISNADVDQPGSDVSLASYDRSQIAKELTTKSISSKSSYDLCSQSDCLKNLKTSDNINSINSTPTHFVHTGSTYTGSTHTGSPKTSSPKAGASKTSSTHSGSNQIMLTRADATDVDYANISEFSREVRDNMNKSQETKKEKLHYPLPKQPQNTLNPSVHKTPDHSRLVKGCAIFKTCVSENLW